MPLDIGVVCPISQLAIHQQVLLVFSSSYQFTKLSLAVTSSGDLMIAKQLELDFQTLALSNRSEAPTMEESSEAPLL